MTIGCRLGTAPPMTAMRLVAHVIPIARSGAATVVSSGSTISLRTTLSNPTTLTSVGTATRARRRPLMTPMARTSL